MIREAVISDKEQIDNLGVLLNPSYKKLFRLSTIINDKFNKLYVYEKNGKIIGFLHAIVLDETIDIINLIVDEKERRKMVASNLFDYMLSEAAETVKMITLEVRDSNLAAINFYKNFGFEIVNRRRGYYDDEDALLMGRVMK